MAIIEFNTKKIKLKEEFEEQFNSPAEEWDNKFKDMPISKVVELGHNVLKSQRFIELYRDLIICVQDIVGEELCCQKRPTFRVQRKSKKSVDFHTDEILSGHPPNMLNIWIPLRKTAKSNCMWIVNESNTFDLLTEFKSKKWTIQELNKKSLEVASPKVINYGQILTFNNKNLHGTIQSSEDFDRYSIDFRLLPKREVNNMGKKKFGFDYIDSNMLMDYKKNKQFKSAISVLYTNYEADIFSHPIQRAMVDQFATSNSLLIDREVAEWQVDHFPQIYAILEEHPNHIIIFATKKSFNQNCNEYQVLCDNLRKHKCAVYFALEGEKLV